MLTFFVPKFTPIFERMSSKGNLPAATTWLLAISDTLQRYGYSRAADRRRCRSYAMRLVPKPTPGRLWVDRMRLSVCGHRPDFSQLRHLAILPHPGNADEKRRADSRIARGSPKMPTGNSVLSAAIATAAENVSTGKALASPLAKCGEFPVEIVEMISVGEEANNLEQVLIEIADTLERQTNRTLDLSCACSSRSCSRFSPGWSCSSSSRCCCRFCKARASFDVTVQSDRYSERPA